MRRSPAVAGILLLGFLLVVACGSDDDGAAPAAGAAVLLVGESTSDPLRERLIASAARYLHAIAGATPAVERFAVPASAESIAAAAARTGAGLVVVLDAQYLVPELVDAGDIAALPEGAYRIATVDVGSHRNLLSDEPGATLLLLAGESRLARQYAVYEALRRLGVRYYHPEAEYLPRLPAAQIRDRARTATAIARGAGEASDEDYIPDFRFRGYTFHSSHPLEHLESFSDGDFPIDDARNAIDWMVKNRGESFRGAGRGVASAEARARRVGELEELRLLLGMTRGVGITLHNVQQGGRPQVDPSSPVPVREQIESLVESALAAAPDATQFGVHFGPTEVSVTPDVETVEWLNWAGRKALELRPDIPVILNNHTSGGQAVDNFDDLGCPPGTNTAGVCDYYDLSFHTDARIGVSVHTVMLPPLEGPAFVYNQMTFAHKLCLMQRASAEGRPLEWFPESSWWLSYDNPVPVYLPLYLGTRQRDVELVAPLLENRGGTLRRHKQFNSGHEWGYWQQDYGVGMWHWNVDVPLDAVLGEIADPLCDPAVWPHSCAARDELVAVLSEMIAHQWEYLLLRTDHRGNPGGLYNYFSGEDPAEELSARAGFIFHPQPVTFAAVAAFSAEEAAHFRDTDVAAMHEMALVHADWLDRLRAVEAAVPPAGVPWLAEVVDGIEINRLRAEHAAALYEAMLAFGAAVRAGADDPTSAAWPLMELADARLAAAEVVIRRREAAYRYPSAQVYGGGLTPETAVPNGTTYPYRVHTKTHLLTFWTVRQERAMAVLAGDEVDPSRFVLAPVFADAGTPLDINWPQLPGVVGSVDLGDGSVVGADTTRHEYSSAGVFVISGTIEIDGTPALVGGAVARTSLRAASPLGALTLRQPSDPVAVEFIRGVSPSFHLAAAGDALAVTADASGSGAFHFDDVVVAPIHRADDGFTSAPFDIRMQLVGLTGADGSPRFIGLGDVVLAGRLDDTGFGDSLAIGGTIAVADVVALLVELVGFDEQGARAFLANVYETTAEMLPADAPFAGTLALR